MGGQPHQRNFSILCCVGKLREAGGGGSKKDAKREAAQKMIDKLKSMGPNNTPAQVNHHLLPSHPPPPPPITSTSSTSSSPCSCR